MKYIGITLLFSPILLMLGCYIYKAYKEARNDGSVLQLTFALVMVVMVTMGIYILATGLNG